MVKNTGHIRAALLQPADLDLTPDPASYLCDQLLSSLGLLLCNIQCDNIQLLLPRVAVPPKQWEARQAQSMAWLTVSTW